MIRTPRKLVALLLCIAVLLPAIAIATEPQPDSNFYYLAYENYQGRIWFNGTYLYSPVPPAGLPGETPRIPLRPILEAIGASIDWDENTQSETIHTADGLEIQLMTASGNAMVNGTPAQQSYITSHSMGYTLVEPAFFSLVEGLDVQWDLSSMTALVHYENARQGDVLLYSLGTQEMRDPNGTDVHYEANGCIALPAGGNRPVVLIMNGAHMLDDPNVNRYDTGFAYLMKALAANGYVAISINVSFNYFYEGNSAYDEATSHARLFDIMTTHYRALVAATRGEENAFGVDLTGRCDLSQVMLIGHSRSGLSAIDVAGMLRKQEDASIRGILSIAPAEYRTPDWADADLPTAMIVPELDGDVVAIDGQKLFQDAQEFENRTADLQLAYLYGANHNAFNEALLEQDRYMRAPEEIQLLAPQAQRAFLTQYALAFLSAVRDERPLSTMTEDSGGTQFGSAVMISNAPVQGHTLYHANQQKNGVKTSGASTRDVLLDVDLDKGTAGIFDVPGNTSDYAMLQIDWHNKNTSVTFEIPEGMADLSAYEDLYLFLAQNSPSARNRKTNQSFAVELVDADGNMAETRLGPDTPALRWHNGVPALEHTIYTNHTPLGMVQLPLDGFSGVDLARISAIRFTFSQTDTGSLMLRFIKVK